MRQRTPDHLLLFGGDRYLATAHDRRIQFYFFDDLPEDGGAARPIAEITTAAPVQRLASRPGEQRPVVIVALADRSLTEVELPEPASGRPYDAKPRIRVLLKDLGGELRFLDCTRRSVLAVVDERAAAGPALVALDAAAGGAVRRARLPLANLTSVSTLDRERSDLLIVVDARHGAHVVGFPADLDGSTLQVTPVDSEVRATAAVALGDQWVVVARKGGELVQVHYTTSVGGRTDAAAEVCRRLRRLLLLCGCDCHPQPAGRGPGGEGAQGPPRPSGSDPGGGGPAGGGPPAGGRSPGFTGGAYTCSMREGS